MAKKYRTFSKEQVEYALEVLQQVIDCENKLSMTFNDETSREKYVPMSEIERIYRATKARMPRGDTE